MSITSLFSSVGHCISIKRIESYRVAGDTDDDVLSRYMWNVCLCEALYPALHSLEIALRNSIYTEVTKMTNNPNWLLDNSVVAGYHQQRAVSKAVSELVSAGKPTDPERIVAATTFGLWTGFMEPRYERILWRSVLRSTFPHAPARIRTRHDLHAHVIKIRKLRNRVFHHEAIWSRADIAAEHATIHNTIGWISPDLKRVTQSIDRFPSMNCAAQLAQIKSLFC